MSHMSHLCWWYIRPIFATVAFMLPPYSFPRSQTTEIKTMELHHINCMVVSPPGSSSHTIPFVGNPKHIWHRQWHCSISSFHLSWWHMSHFWLSLWLKTQFCLLFKFTGQKPMVKRISLRSRNGATPKSLAPRRSGPTDFRNTVPGLQVGPRYKQTKSSWIDWCVTLQPQGPLKLFN